MNPDICAILSRWLKSQGHYPNVISTRIIDVPKEKNRPSAVYSKAGEWRLFINPDKQEVSVHSDPWEVFGQVLSYASPTFFDDLGKIIDG